MNINQISKQVFQVLWDHRETIMMAMDIADKATSSREKKEKIRLAKESFAKVIIFLENLGVSSK
jgi:hypothetical protein